MSKGRRSPRSPRFLATRCLSLIAAALVGCGLAAAARAAPGAWSQRTVRGLHIAVLPLTSVNEIARSSRIRMRAVTNARHAPAAPEIPAVAQLGYPQFTLGGMLGIFGPKDMLVELRERIAADMRGVLAEPAVIATLANIGMAAHVTTPAEFAAILDEQRAKWAAIAPDHDIKPVH